MIANISYIMIWAAIGLGCLATAFYSRHRMDIRDRLMKEDLQNTLDAQQASQNNTIRELQEERERVAKTLEALRTRVQTIIDDAPQHDTNILQKALANVHTELGPTLERLTITTQETTSELAGVSATIRSAESTALTHAQQLTTLNATSNNSGEEIKLLKKELSQLRAFAEAANTNANNTAAQVGGLWTDIESNFATERLGDVEQLAIVAANMAGAGLAKLQLDAPSSISPMLHGHSMMMYQMLMDASSNRVPKAEQGFQLLEIGTTREKWWSQMSTSRLAATCRTLNYRMITVDVDQRNTASGLKANRFYDNTVSAETALGEEFVANWEGKLPPYIYIDAYDYEHEHHSKDRQARYLELQGEQISNEACWEMHYKCAVEFVAKCPDNGIVVFDDVFQEDGEWLGKGKTAAPYMLKNGFELIAQNPQTAVFRKRPVE